MARGWYGLYLGDRVVYDIGTGRKIEGTIVKLFVSDRNKGLLIDDDGKEHTIVCEFCAKIPPTNGIFKFRPLSDIQYTVLIYEFDGYLKVYTFLGNEIEKNVMGIISDFGDEIEKIAIYVRETASNLNSLYQEINQNEFIEFYKG
ncbi:hypothetical protein [Paenibacillus oleatilyticus]|uniref:hypothetical protein n=1 Tax=Paenibacillus oleatilyticus TaxID=2594886 RepID=UPI001C200494|nr:hypothetical protein [Paenibacillus oleatilyticus]MBU7316107.1 hypothetical protein [Paenibacillus oleatilyticus]